MVVKHITLYNLKQLSLILTNTYKWYVSKPLLQIITTTNSLHISSHSFLFESLNVILYIEFRTIEATSIKIVRALINSICVIIEIKEKCGTFF